MRAMIMAVVVVLLQGACCIPLYKYKRECDCIGGEMRWVVLGME